jgi:hypothetical protein
MDITHVSLVEERPVLKYSNTKGSDSHKAKSLAHPDLVKAVDDLSIHFAILSGQLVVPDKWRTMSLDGLENMLQPATEEILDEPESDVDLEDRPVVCNLETIYENCTCTGFTYKANALVLHGTRKLETYHGMKSIEIDTPTYVFHGDIYKYRYHDELEIAIDAVKNEVALYLEGKTGNQQMSLFEESDLETETVTTDGGATEKPKRGRKPKRDVLPPFTVTATFGDSKVMVDSDDLPFEE